MKRPATEWPCSIRRLAATAESTPPDKATMTLEGLESGMHTLYVHTPGQAGRSDVEGVDAEIRQRSPVDHVERKAPAADEVVHAAHDERAAVPRLIREQFLACEPQGPQDAAIERALRVEALDDARECNAQERATIRRILPQVDSGQGLRPESPGGLFERLADDRFDQGLAGLKMARRLIQHHPTCRTFFDQQEAVVTHDNGGDRDVRLQCLGRRVYPRAMCRSRRAVRVRFRAWRRQVHAIGTRRGELEVHLAQAGFRLARAPCFVEVVEILAHD